MLNNKNKFLNLKENKRQFLVFIFGIASHILTSLFFLIAVAVAIGALAFYNHYIVTEEESVDISSEVNFKKSSYDEMVSFWNKNQERFDNADKKTYKNFFEKITPIVKEAEKK